MNLEYAEHQHSSTCHGKFSFAKPSVPQEIIAHGSFCFILRKKNPRNLLLLVLITIGKCRLLNRTCKHCEGT